MIPPMKINPFPWYTVPFFALAFVCVNIGYAFGSAFGGIGRAMVDCAQDRACRKHGHVRDERDDRLCANCRRFVYVP